MLEWGSNFKETMSVTCRHCDTKDDENHRLNECKNREHLNQANYDEKYDFSDIYSEDTRTVNNTIRKIEKVLEFRHANGRMKNALSS